MTFKSVLFNSYMSAEGILLEDVTVSKDIRKFSDAIFCIHLQRKYSASRELQSYMKTNQIDISSVEDESTLKYLQALEVNSTSFIILLFFLATTVFLFSARTRQRKCVE